MIRHLQILLMLAVASPALCEELLVTNVRVYTGPGEVVQGTNLLVRDGVVVEPGSSDTSAGRVIDGRGLTASAGFFNAHVHLTDPRLAENASQILTGMLLRYGFTTVLDTGSDLPSTLALKAAIRSGALKGPRILTANGSFVTKDGTPSYLPAELRLPEVDSAARGRSLTRNTLGAGADGIKIFAGSFKSPEHTAYLPVELIEIVSTTAHQMDSFVVAHPTTMQGLTNAVRGGVDVLAHTTSEGDGVIPDDIITLMKQNQVAVIPTLSLWRYEMMRFTGNPQVADRVESAAVGQLAQLLANGVGVLFGTDVGYMTQFDTAHEFELMQRAGMSWPQIHTALTTRPATRFGTGSGTLAPGETADIVLLDGDPQTDLGALSRVAFTIINGQVVYEADK